MHSIFHCFGAVLQLSVVVDRTVPEPTMAYTWECLDVLRWTGRQHPLLAPDQ